MRFLFLLVALAILAGVAAVTKPTQAEQKAHMDELFAAQTRAQVAKLDLKDLVKGALADVARVDAYRDLVVASSYTAAANDKPLATCWGAFKRFYCSGFAAEAKPATPPSTKPAT